MIRHKSTTIIETVIWTTAFLVSIISKLCKKGNYVTNNLILSGNSNDNGFGFGGIKKLDFPEVLCMSVSPKPDFT